MFKSRLNCKVMMELPNELVEVIWFSGNLAKLAFERRGDGRGHDVRAGAGIKRLDLNGGVIDLRQGGNGQLAVSHKPYKKDAHHQEGGGDRP